MSTKAPVLLTWREVMERIWPASDQPKNGHKAVMRLVNKGMWVAGQWIKLRATIRCGVVFKLSDVVEFEEAVDAAADNAAIEVATKAATKAGTEASAERAAPIVAGRITGSLKVPSVFVDEQDEPAFERCPDQEIGTYPEPRRGGGWRSKSETNVPVGRSARARAKDVSHAG